MAWAVKPEVKRVDLRVPRKVRFAHFNRQRHSLGRTGRDAGPGKGRAGKVTEPGLMHPNKEPAALRSN